MLGNTFYFSLIRSYVIFFGSLFNDIYINRNNSNNEVIQTLKVPISYGPKEKMLTRVESDLTLQKPFAIILPRLSFELLTLKYDASRKWMTNRKVSYKVPDKPIIRVTQNPVPYNLSFGLYLAVKNNEDATKILEQILPYFTPEWTAKLNLIPEMNIQHDIPVVLGDISTEDIYEGEFSQRKAIIWTLQFTLKGYLYGPITESGQIKQIFINYRIPTNNAILTVGPTVAQSYIQPGLTANGEPTTNVTFSIPPDEIQQDDNWGFIVDFDTSNT